MLMLPKSFENRLNYGLRHTPLHQFIRLHTLLTFAVLGLPLH